MIICHLKRLLNREGISQQELYRQTGIRPQTITNLCNNSFQSFPVHVTDLLCRRLNCSVEELFSYLEEMS